MGADLAGGRTEKVGGDVSTTPARQRRLTIASLRTTLMTHTLRCVASADASSGAAASPALAAVRPMMRMCVSCELGTARG